MIGVFRPANMPFNQTTTGQWLPRNSVTPGTPDVSFFYGAPGDIPVVGDWTGGGVDTIGVFRPANTPFNQTTTGLWLHAGRCKLRFLLRRSGGHSGRW